MASIPTKLSSDVVDKYSINLDTKSFSAIPKDDWKDKIEVELGDSKDSTDVFPQVKVMRWDNEVNFSARLKDFSNYSLSTDKEKIKLVNSKKEVHLYDLTEGYEFEVVLKEKPLSNIVEFTLQTKGLDFFYQPALTQEEIDKGAVRPENVVGSYAVYASENKINYVGGKEYKVGKVGHIFRPRIIDSIGTEVWGELKIEKDILSVTIPQEFLDKAVYPVRHAAGLTFGYTTAGGSWSSSTPDEIHGTLATGASGSANSISAYFVPNGYYKGILVLKSNKNIISNGITDAYGNVGGPGWQTATYSTSPTISAVDYYVCAIQDTGAQTSLWYDSGTGFDDISNSYSSPSNPTDGTEGSNKYSIYCTYTAGGGGATAVPPRRTLLGVGA